MTTHQKQILEVDLVIPLTKHFSELGYDVVLEMSIYRNRADMIAYTENSLIAIELKLRNWKRALRQAAYYQLGADLSYIAMPFYEAFEVYKRSKLLERERVGLLAVLMNSSEVRELIKPKPSIKKLEYVEEQVRKNIHSKYEAEEIEDFLSKIF